MAASSEDIVQEVKSRVDITEVVSEYVPLRPAGRRQVGLCPFHSEKTPSFGVSPDKQSWYCFGCGEGGDVIKFIEKIENLPFREALERLARRAGIALPEWGRGPNASEKDRLRELHEWATGFYEQALARADAPRDYLARRGMADEVRARFRLGYAPDSWDALRNFLRSKGANDDEMLKAGLLLRKDGDTRGGYDRFRDRLLFPIADAEGRVIAFGGRILGEGQPKYLNSPETPLFSKSRVLYGLHRALAPMKARKEALVMEGYMDVLAAHEFGFDHAVAPLGTALTEGHLQLLRRTCERVYLVFDADSAGIRAALRSLALFEKIELEARVVVLPAGEDPDSLLRKGGAAPFAQALADAQPILDYRMNAIVAQHDIRTDEGYTKACREIVPLLSQVEASRWVHKLAQLRSDGDATRVVFHEEDLLRHIRGLRGAPAPKPERSSAPRQEGQKPAPEAPKVSVAVRKLYKAEELLLKACLDDRATAARILPEDPGDLFVREETRALAALARKSLSGADWNPAAWAVENDPLQSLLGRLAADPTPVPDAPALDGLVELLRLHREQPRMKPLTEGRTPSADEWAEIKEFYRRKKPASARDDEESRLAS